MFSKFRNDEGGFTLIELLVVILIIGILAAIALPTFLGQQKKGQDSEAKSNARNAVTQVESCFADKQDYRNCVTADLQGLSTGLPLGIAQGQVNVASSAIDGYVITAYSKSGTNFTITKTSGGAPVRACNNNSGGCNGTSW